ncbi:hypothetical protein KKC13_11510 [bacterium]|nr:hypothetical protein [bacterium]MBU1957920.1 hypothetical protein [bacterium]
MSWYKVTFKQLQPIHLGHRKHRVINETRIFITGQMMWGALTNAYFHQTGDYEATLFENLSCFYPKIRWIEFKPQYKNGEFCLNNVPEAKFRQKYVTTLLSTAINPNTLNAKDESLHELDVILPNNLYWVGYVNCNKEILKELKEIFIGGDSRYGFGLMKLESIEEATDYTQNPIKGKSENFTSNQPLTNFVKFTNQKFEGRLELLAEYDFSKNRPKILNSFYISSGSKIL